jgi:hypothetical protein
MVGGRPTLVPTSRMNHNHRLPASPGINSQQYQQRPTPSDATMLLKTVCFYDHRQRLALMVLPLDLNQPRFIPSNPSGMLRGGFSTSPNDRVPAAPTSPGPPGIDPKAKPEALPVTIQLYIHSSGSFLKSAQGLQTVENWCKKLQHSEAFQFLRQQLSEHAGISQHLPQIHIEAYEAFLTYKVLIVGY